MKSGANGPSNENNNSPSKKRNVRGGGHGSKNSFSSMNQKSISTAASRSSKKMTENVSGDFEEFIDKVLDQVLYYRVGIHSTYHLFYHI